MPEQFTDINQIALGHHNPNKVITQDLDIHKEYLEDRTHNLVLEEDFLVLNIILLVVVQFILANSQFMVEVIM